MTSITYGAFAGLAVLCAFFAFIVARYGLMFFREVRGARRLSTLAGAAAVIAIIVNTLVGTFTQPIALVRRSPVAAPAAAGGATPPHDGLREEPAARP